MTRTQFKIFRHSTLLVLLLGALLLIGGCGSRAQDKLYQYGPFFALADGHFDGDFEVSQLKHHGYIGLGTFNRLDGEMIVLDEVYQIRSDGQAAIADNSLRTPFAQVMRLSQPTTRAFDAPMSLPELQHSIEALCGDARGSIIVARIDGLFSFVRVRSVPAQEKPYPTLAEAVKHQKEYEYHNIRGTIVAFRFPSSAGNMNVPAWHMHFINAQRKLGGHVLDVRSEDVQVAGQTTTLLEISLPRHDVAAASAPAAGGPGPE